MLKEEFVKKPTLAFADPEKPMRVKADASKFTTEAALCKMDGNCASTCCTSLVPQKSIG